MTESMSNPSPQIGKRIIIIGSTGSGKTTLASQLADVLAVPHIELDALQFLPNWEVVSREEFRQKATEAVNIHTEWVMDGNYSILQDITWARADTFIWLDYHILVNTWRLLKRSVARSITKEELWNTGNQENLWQHLFTRDSLFLWLFKTHARRQRTYPVRLAEQEALGKIVIRLQSPKATNSWFEQFVTEFVAETKQLDSD